MVGDTDTVTEAALRVQFDRAAACSPCVLVLRYLDALSQSTQSGEAAQGTAGIECAITRTYAHPDTVPAAMAALQACIQEAASDAHNIVVIIATTTDPDHLPASALSMFKHDLILAVSNNQLLSNSRVLMSSRHRQSRNGCEY
jgi:peroxin-6